MAVEAAAGDSRVGLDGREREQQAGSQQRRAKHGGD
jgi:hypothetical protein